MIRVSITELRRHLDDVLSQVADGETFEVTRRGKPVIRIEPPDRQQARLLKSGIGDTRRSTSNQSSSNYFR